MRVLALALVVQGAAACKPKEVPFQPPPKDDAAVQPVDASEVDAAVARAAPREVKKVVVGDHVTCALLVDATVRCWGRNQHGQLGIGTTEDAASPVRPNLLGVTDIVLGDAHACALLDDESVTCWGNINYGRKGLLLSPSAAPGVAKAKRLFAVGGASCATIADGSLVCWGDIDVKGRIRRSGGTTRAPSPWVGLSRVAALTANGALTEDGTVWYWGETGEPVRTTMTNVVEIASIGDRVCGLSRDGSVACAGPKAMCAAAVPKPAAPAKPAPAKQPARKSAKTAKGNKQTSKPAAKPAPPEPAIVVEVLRLPPAKHLAFDAGSCVVTRTGRFQCLDARDACKAEAPWPGLVKVDYVTGTCARMVDGDVRCWSADAGDKRVHDVAGVAGAVAVAAGTSHACAVLADRSLACWGSNLSGALGRGDVDEQTHREASPITF